MSRAWSRREVVGAGVAAGGAWLLGGCKGPQPTAEPPRTAALREATAAVLSVPTQDGAGVALRRAIGTRALPLVDPFLMLDEFRSDDPADYLAGFPDHPHRGFETVTLMLDGAMEHRDSVGNAGRLGPGSVQWMTAGRGLVHSEMPKQERGRMWGYQLWVNLPRSHKMIAPRYQDLAPSTVPTVDGPDGAHVRVLAGEAGGRRGPVQDVVTAPLFLDVSVAKGGRFRHPVPAEHNALLYVVSGAVLVGGQARRAAGQTTVVLPATVEAPFRLAGGRASTGGRTDLLEVRAPEGARFLVLAGRPIREPVARGGPFVMNTEVELRQAWDDYRSGRLVRGS